MQIISDLSASPETYVREKLHTRVKPPKRCPNCGQPGKLQALGYYERGVVSQGHPAYVRFLVRRFRCVNCRRTVSVLPAFSQPYRLIGSRIIGHYFRGGSSVVPPQWTFLLTRYWKRFADWLPILVPKVRRGFKFPMGMDTPLYAWRLIEKGLGNIGMATLRLTRRCRVTLFGAYLCHQPFCSEQRNNELHTTGFLLSGKDPPGSGV